MEKVFQKQVPLQYSETGSEFILSNLNGETFNFTELSYICIQLIKGQDIFYGEQGYF